MSAKELPVSMEPMLPPAGQRELEDLVLRLTSKASALAAKLPEQVTASIGDLVRSMNCYYSNLIEGHNTHPRDIDRALRRQFDKEPKRRQLQLEAVAHIHVQGLIDAGRDPLVAPTSVEYLRWVHREFCQRLPPELLVVINPDTGKSRDVVPGELREETVVVGRHLPPSPNELDGLLRRFEDAYAFEHLSAVQRIVSVAASHHRLLWIHPFLDGNGRVARLVAHALLRRAGVGNSLWSVARGLARKVDNYRRLLEEADEPRRDDRDGRGSLSERGLVDFSTFFLEVCCDQVDFMDAILESSELARRLALYVRDEIAAGRLPDGAFPVLREALMAGQVDRALARSLTGYRERSGRAVVSQLLASRLLVSEGDRAPLRLGFPVDVVERWFPRLYPPS